MGEEKEAGLRFRDQKIVELLQKIKMCAGGFEQRIRPLLLDEKGSYSEDKTRALIDGIMEGIGEISEWIPEFEPELCRQYRSLLYCAVRAVTTPYTFYRENGAYDAFSPGEVTFAELLEELRAEEEEMDISSGIGLVTRKIGYPLYQTMSEIYHVLTGKEIPEEADLRWKMIQTEEQKKLEKEFYDSLMDDAEDEEEALGDEGGRKEDYEDYLREYEKYQQEQEDLKRRQEEQRKRLKESFAFAGEYCGRYEEIFRYPEKNYQPLRFNRHMEMLLGIYLQKQGYSVGNGEEDYFTALVYLKKAYRVMRRQEAEE